MTRYPIISFNNLIAVAKKLGFQQTRQKGSHIRFIHQDGRKITIPDHSNKDVPKGLLFKIIKYDLELTADDFFKLIR
ncbi:MAG: type II toxin-antitoxin system HicA family toxin [Deltaproteobacteria bacterium]|nr:type II toxin-antitoxin system HicA family toxin [Deltaproteobacteria bacterium]